MTRLLRLTCDRQYKSSIKRRKVTIYALSVISRFGERGLGKRTKTEKGMVWDRWRERMKRGRRKSGREKE